MKAVFIFLFLISIKTTIRAQSPEYKIDNKTVVLDTNGKTIPFSVWQPLYQLGTYGLQAIDPQNPNTTFVLVRLHENVYADVWKKLPMPPKSHSFITGKKFSLFEATDINNHVINLKKAKGKIIVLFFWYIRCSTCQLAIPELNNLVATYKGNDKVMFVSVAWDKNYALKQFLQKKHFDYDNIGDGFLLAKQYYGIDAYPTHVIVDQEGKVYFHTIGFLPNTLYWLKKSINELLQPAVTQK